MKNLKLMALIVITLSFLSCNRDGGTSSEKKAKVKPVVQVQVPSTNTTNSGNNDGTDEIILSKSYSLQVSALNFLQGGLEKCDANDKIFMVNDNDENVKIVVCRNSKVELSMISDKGMVTYQAINLMTGEPLPMKETGTKNYYELGKMDEMTRYWVENPYGFTYLMVQDVSGINQEDLARYNFLNNRLSQLKGQIIFAQQNGLSVDPAVYEEMQKIEIEMSELSKKMYENRKK